MLGNMCTEELVYFDFILQEGVLEKVKFFMLYSQLSSFITL